MKLDLMDFAYSYITRSGRIDDARLRAMSPRFMARYEARSSAEETMTHEIADQVPPDCAGAREIGFAIPEIYNASRILFDNLDKGLGDRLALIGPLGTRSYAELCADACRWGHGLISLGLKRGDRVLMFLDDTPAYPAAFFGAVRAGFVPLLINTLTPPDLLQFYLVGFRRYGGGRRRRVLRALRRDGLQGHAAHDADRGQRRRGRPCRSEHVDRRNHGSPGFPTELAEADTHRNEMAFWMYSSGSTGRPKGIVHLQHDMAYSERAFARDVLKLSARRHLLFRAENVLRLRLRQFHHLSVLGRCGDAAVAGPTQTGRDFRRRSRAIARPFSSACRRSTRPSPRLTAPTRADFSSLRMALSAAEVLSADVFNGWKRLTGLEIIEGLGSTEVLHIYLSNRDDKKKLGAAGLRVPGYEIALKD